MFLRHPIYDAMMSPSAAKHGLVTEREMMAMVQDQHIISCYIIIERGIHRKRSLSTRVAGGTKSHFFFAREDESAELPGTA